MFKNRTKIIMWVVLWLVTWGISQSLWGGDPLKATPAPGTILVIFIISIVLAFLIFTNERKVWLSGLSSLQILIILLSVGTFSFLDTRLFVSNLLTASHILFQQFMIGVLVFMIPSEKFRRSALRVLLLFGASHLLLAFFMSWTWTIFFTFLASATAVVFAYLIQRVKYGITVSFLIHLSFYLLFFKLI